MGILVILFSCMFLYSCALEEYPRRTENASFTVYVDSQSIFVQVLMEENEFIFSPDTTGWDSDSLSKETDTFFAIGGDTLLACSASEKYDQYPFSIHCHSGIILASICLDSIVVVVPIGYDSGRRDTLPRGDVYITPAKHTMVPVSLLYELAPSHVLIPARGPHDLYEHLLTAMSSVGGVVHPIRTRQYSFTSDGYSLYWE
ncbi:hypothetical protein [Chitinivibrio alkaliphilus]|uniref:Uncharacterized protein n=1 Tax=Chitinivibrio alkaliphilus ACht1 TaxID=1313304 RepID=U7D9X8_9BACT|nr:hypothetical protein [Chitinivibrio alkaliphilus]ERP38792.1 hypothetical protein CALK_0562 [Chitinivibrio alkaliphilus ACht1]